MAPLDTPSKCLITNLNVKDIEALTRVLNLQAVDALDATWFANQAQQIDSLPKKLLAPKSGLTRTLARVTSSLHIGTQKATLCHAHRELHPQLIRRIFIQLAKECTIRNAGLVTCASLPCEVKEWLKRIQIINSLWMSPELYRVAFNTLPEDIRLDQVESGCEACILSIVGGHQVMLLDLHNSAESRRKKSPIKPPAILRFLDAWLAGTGLQQPPIKAHEIMKSIRQVRREVLVERRMVRSGNTNGKNPATNIVNDQSSEFGKFKFDFEHVEGREKEEHGNQDYEDEAGLITIFYKDKFTDTPGRPKGTHPAEGMHPAFQQSMNFSGGYSGATAQEMYRANASSSGSEHGDSSSSNTWRPGDNGAYGEGAYIPPRQQRPVSDHESAKPKRHWYDESIFDPSETSIASEEAACLSSAPRAAAYRTLFGKEPEPEPESDSGPDWGYRDRMSSHSAETRWSDFGRSGKK